MKIALEQSTTTVDLDPEDLTDEALKECIEVARARGLLKAEAPREDSRVEEMQREIGYAYSSLLVGQPQMALARLAFFIPRDAAEREMAKAFGYMAPKDRFTRDSPPVANGHGRAPMPPNLR